MRRSSFGPGLVVGLGTVSALAYAVACGGSNSVSITGGKHDAGGSTSDGTVISLDNDSGGGGGGGSGSGSGSVTCPAGLSCNVTCSGGGTTTVSGKVYDPAGKVPLYDVAVYVPANPLTALPRGVPTGSQACSCPALFPSGAVTNTTTDVTGAFKLTNVPVGSDVPLVLQVGKWRRALKINVTQCQDNPQTSLTLPGTIAAGDTDDNMPDIAVSTGSADTLECLLVRMGVPETEYVAGASTSGHVHIFSGGAGGGHGGGGNTGTSESPAMKGAPASYASLWDKPSDLMPYDVVLLSCEGGETYKANPQVLESYLNAGGRAFASHFHYAFFSGPLGSGQAYKAPTDWGSNLATWSVDQGNMTNSDIGGDIVSTLNGSTQPFAKGATLSAWLEENGALGGKGITGACKGGGQFGNVTCNAVPATQLPIYQPRYNAKVGASNKPSQPWITAAADSTDTGATMYFSFDTPVNAPTGDGGMPAYCGRAVFSDLHVGGNPDTSDSNPPPAGCDKTELSPQEKALEFMLFDLSSCVLPDTVAPAPDAGFGQPK